MPKGGGEDPLTIPALVARQAQRAGNAVALAAPGRKPLDYRTLAKLIEESGVALGAMGVARGDRLAIVLPNGPEMATAFLAVASWCSAAPLNPGYRREEFEFYLSDLHAAGLVVLAGAESAAREAAGKLGIRIIELTPRSAAPAGAFDLSGPLAPVLRGEGGGEGGREGQAALLLHTSGTTSRPKLVPLSHVNLCTSAGNVASTLQLSPADRCLNVMPLFHIHGLVGCLLSSMSAGASVVCAPGFVAPEFFPWIDQFAPTWYSAVPTIHQAVLARAAEHAQIIARRPMRLIRSSSAPLPPQVLAELERTFGAPVVEAYGMTEAAHQMASNPLPPAMRKPGSVGLPAGPEVAIMDAAGALLGRGATAEVVIRGANITHGYEANPSANESAFTNGWFRTGDQGYIDEDGYLFLTGRLKELINRGGEKISPREVDEVLLDHPAVAQALAFAVPDERLGEDVAAAVVLKAEASATELELRQFAAGRLADFKVPCRIVLLNEIPKGPTGKPQRVGLAAKLGLTGAAEPAHKTGVGDAGYRAPRTDVEKQLAEIWQGVLKRSPIGIEDRFLQIGGDSILATQIVARIRESMRVGLSVLGFFEAGTIARLAVAILALRASADEQVISDIENMSEEDAARMLEAEAKPRNTV